MQVLSIDDTHAWEMLADVIAQGRLAVIPTDTCYGVICDASNDNAVEQLYKYKERDVTKPTGIYVDSIDMASLYVELTAYAKQLYSKYFPGALTVISKSRYKLAGRIEITGTLGVRIPNLPFLLDVIDKIDKPFAQTSANLAGAPTPYSLADLKKYTPGEKLNEVALIIDGGESQKRMPSTIVDASTPTPQIVRHGDLEISI